MRLLLLTLVFLLTGCESLHLAVSPNVHMSDAFTPNDSFDSACVGVDWQVNAKTVVMIDPLCKNYLPSERHDVFQRVEVRVRPWAR